MEFISPSARRLFSVINNNRPELQSVTADVIGDTIIPILQEEEFQCTPKDIENVVNNIHLAHESAMPANADAKLRHDATTFASVFIGSLSDALAQNKMLIEIEE